MHVTEDRLARASTILAPQSSRKAAADVPETGRNFRKDVKIIRNEPKKSFRINKSFKKRTQTKSKRSGRTCCKCAKRPKRTEKVIPNGQVWEEWNNPFQGHGGWQDAAQRKRRDKSGGVL